LTNVAGEQRLSEPYQGIAIGRFARLAKGRRGHTVSQRLVVGYVEETTQLITNATLAQIQQHGHKMGQRKRSVAGEIRSIHSRGDRKLVREQELIYERINKIKSA